MRLLKIISITLSLFLTMRVKASAGAEHSSEHGSKHHVEAAEHGAKHHEETSSEHHDGDESESSEEKTAKVYVPQAFESQFEVLHEEKSFITNKQLISGSHWVRNSQNYDLKTPYGNIESHYCDFYVKYEGTKVTVVNHFGKLKVNLRDGGTVDVPPGFVFWFSEIKSDKKNLMGFIEPVELKDHILTLGKLWTEDQDSFKSVMLKIQSRWGDRTSAAAQYYKGLALRKIASVQKEEDRVQGIRNAESNRRAANRKLLYQRAFGR